MESQPRTAVTAISILDLYVLMPDAQRVMCYVRKQFTFLTKCQGHAYTKHDVCKGSAIIFSKLKCDELKDSQTKLTSENGNHTN
jgi:hypothetical protein